MSPRKEPDQGRARWLDGSPLSWLVLRWALNEPTDEANPRDWLRQLRQRVRWLGEAPTDPSDREFLRQLARPFIRRALSCYYQSLGRADYSPTDSERLTSLLLDLEPRPHPEGDVYRLYIFTEDGPAASSSVCPACETKVKVDGGFCASPLCSFTCRGCGGRTPAGGEPAPAEALCASCAWEEAADAAGH